MAVGQPTLVVPGPQPVPSGLVFTTYVTGGFERHRLKSAISVLSDGVPGDLRRSPLGWTGYGRGAWEAAHDMELPEPYRTFVAEACNGALEGAFTAHRLLPSLGQV
jgi:hypothetical protein